MARPLWQTSKNFPHVVSELAYPFQSIQCLRILLTATRSSPICQKQITHKVEVDQVYLSLILFLQPRGELVLHPGAKAQRHIEQGDGVLDEALAI